MSSRYTASIYNWLGARRVALVVGVALATLYLSVFAFKAYFEIDIKTFEGNGTYFKVYWAPADQDFSESHSKRIRIRGGDFKLKMFVGNLRKIGKLRVDPIEYGGKALIKSIAISQRGYAPIHLGPDQLGALSALNQIESSSLTSQGLEVITSGKDGNLQLTINPRSNGSFPWVHPINALLIVLLSLALGSSVTSLQKQNLYVILGLTVALVLAAVMATITTIYVHPDERVHLEAVNYYSHHVLPPSLDSPEIVNSFSDYGKSRLSTYEAYYPVAGWFSWLLSPMNLSPLMSARAFGVVLLSLLLIFTVVQPQFRYFALPLIVSPQIWYMYGYPNSDIFALTLCLIAGYQFAVPDSILNRLLSQPKPRMLVPGIVGFGVLAGLLLLSKLNFYFFLLFVFLYLVWRQFHGDFARPWRVWSRLALIGVLGLSMYGGRIALEFAANGPDPQARFNEYVELHAKDEFKPSTPLHDKHIYLNLRGRGKPLDIVTGFLNWGSVTFSTAFGAYGYTQYFASDNYFTAVKALVALLFGAMICYALVYGPSRSHTLILLAIACSGLLIAASIWNSWNENFQAQGRYMAPMVPMIAMVYYHLREYVNPRVISAIAMTLFVLSVYSFVFIGLDQIAKTSVYTGVG